MRPSGAARFFGCGSGTSSGAGCLLARTVVCSTSSRCAVRQRNSSALIETRLLHQVEQAVDQSAPDRRRVAGASAQQRRGSASRPCRVTTISSANTASCSAHSFARWKRSAQRARQPESSARSIPSSQSSGVRDHADHRAPANRAVRSAANRIIAEHDDDADHRRGGGAEPGVARSACRRTSRGQWRRTATRRLPPSGG